MKLFIPEYKKVNGRTRSPRGGRLITCPTCVKNNRVYHFSWSALQCQHCKSMIEKNNWYIQP